MIAETSIDVLLTEHPAFSHSEDLRQICAPLSTIGINYFSHIRTTVDQNKVSILALRPDYLEHYIRKKYYQFDLHNKNPTNSIELVIGDNINRIGKSKIVHNDFIDFGLGHTC